LQLPRSGLIERFLWGHFSRPPFLRPTLLVRRSRFQGRLVGDAVQEAAHRLALGDGRGLSHEHEERRLKRILGVVGVPQHTAADAQHHRPVPPYQRLKGGLVAPRQETGQKFRVG